MDIHQEEIFIGIDLHQLSWHVTARLREQELFSGSIPGQWSELEKLLVRWEGGRITVCYEAGYFGFWLHDKLKTKGISCLVAAPSLLPKESGNRVKTDRKDSRKLALLLSKGLLRGIHVPAEQELAMRQLLRHRRTLIRDRAKIKNRIKALFRFHGRELPTGTTWSKGFLLQLQHLNLGNESLNLVLQSQLRQHEHLSEEICLLGQRLKAIGQEKRDELQILTSIPGMGEMSALELLLELGPMQRFAEGKQLAAYVGLTPSQYSSGQHVRMGRIAKTGRPQLRATLVEVAWGAMRYDAGYRALYERLKAHRGGKRAITALARRILLMARAMLSNREQYRPLLATG